MTLKSAVRLLPVLVAAVLSACATQPDVGFTKVKIYHLNPDARVDAVDPSIPFEQKHLLHGALTNEEKRAREGNYYTFFWRAADTKSPVKLRLEYRQAKTGFAVKKQEMDVTDVSSRNVAKFQITGDEYHTGGKIIGWRVTLIQNGQEIGQRRSFNWE